VRLRRAFGAGILAAFAAFSPLSAQDDDEGSLSLAGFVGLQNQPGGFDVFRSVQYDAAKLVGGSIVLGLYPALSVRGDFALALSSGQEGAPINESVDLNRSYYGVSLELKIPSTGGISPFVFGGGGMVKLRRSAPSYNFDLTESGAMFGGGIAWQFRDSPASAFLQVTEWIYSRTSAGGTQFDTSVVAGLRYRFPL
jgi:hypothetical protein